jgi:hypothetical protein
MQLAFLLCDHRHSNALGEKEGRHPALNDYLAEYSKRKPQRSIPRQLANSSSSAELSAVYLYLCRVHIQLKQ